MMIIDRHNIYLQHGDYKLDLSTCDSLGLVWQGLALLCRCCPIFVFILIIITCLLCKFYLILIMITTTHMLVIYHLDEDVFIYNIISFPMQV